MGSLRRVVLQSCSLYLKRFIGRRTKTDYVLIFLQSCSCSCFSHEKGSASASQGYHSVCYRDRQSRRLRSEFGQDNVVCFRRKGLFVRNMHILYINFEKYLTINNHLKATFIAWHCDSHFKTGISCKILMSDWKACVTRQTLYLNPTNVSSLIFWEKIL